MDKLKRLRKPERTAVTKLLGAMDVELQKEDMNKDFLQARLSQVEDAMAKLDELDEKIKLTMLDKDETTDEDFEAEYDGIALYKNRVALMKVKVNAILFPMPNVGSPTRTEASGGGFSSASQTKRNYKLPKIEMKKFSGELKEWLGWWAQFKKIHEDEELHESDKFSYLDLGVIKGSRAWELVDSYPQSVENYPKVIKALKQRFGNEKMLRQVYVRELISMILVNRSGEKVALVSMFDKLVAHLRSLESLGVTVDQMVEFLFPMVESSLPEEILLAWQRSPNFGRDGTGLQPPKSELDFLMDFLKQEIENEEQRKLARAGFNSSDKKKGQRRREAQDEDDTPTAAGLFSGSSVKTPCIFCEKSNHGSKDCFRAPRLSAEEKKGKVVKAKACFLCLAVGCRSTKCKAPKCLFCGGRHHVMLCPEVKEKRGTESTPKKETVQTVQSTLNCTSEVILRTLMIWVKNPVTQQEKKVRVLLDCGSQRSYVLQKTAEDLGLTPVNKITMNHELFGGTEIHALSHSVYDVKLSSTNGPFQTTVRIMDQKQLCGVVPRVSSGPLLLSLWRRGIRLSDCDRADTMEIELLIGADILGDLITGRIHRLKKGLIATETKFGWCLMGQMAQLKDKNNLALSSISLSVCSATVEELWKLDTLGICDPVEVQSSAERDKATHEHFQQTVTRDNNGRYAVSLPWVDREMKLPSNKQVAFKRLEATTRKLVSMGKYEDYDAIFKAWESEGIISKIGIGRDESQLKCHYLPHRAVIKEESKTTPLRPVFDASCKVGRAPSLNDALEKGPNLLELIPSILLRFRMGKIGVISDIRKAFLMINVQEEDRDALRFLWWEDQEKNEVTVYRHNRVVFGMNCSPFLLAAVIDFHLQKAEKSHPDVVKLLRSSLYVDNCVTSVDCVGDYENLKSVATEIMAEASMDLRMWECSRDKNENRMTSVLGLEWDKEEDALFCTPLCKELQFKVTKRVMLSQLHQIFDPLGFLSPVTIIPKLLLQKAWVEDRKWEEEVSEELSVKFGKWWNDTLAMMELFRIPRNCTGGIGRAEGSHQIHVFSDASKEAFAAVVYLRTETKGQVTVQMLQSKARPGPVKQATIPRLELLGCTIAARLYASVKKALSLEETPAFFWSDSSTALAWIKRNDEWGKFVGNRVKEILQLTKEKDWNHVPGVMNPADLPSRGIEPSKFIQSNWWEGPAWLKLDRSEWPSTDCQPNEEEVNAERKKGIVNVATKLVVATKSSTDPWYIVKKSYIRNLRVLALVCRCIDKMRKRSNEGGLFPTVEEINSTELRLFKIVQVESFSGIDKQVNGLWVERDSDGLIRVRTKIVHRQDSFGFKYPVLLPNCHPMVDLLIRDEHIFGCHGGAQYVICSLREKCWILRGKEAIKKNLRSCVICQRYTSKKMEAPRPPLPADRVNDAGAFEVTGIDLAGPLVLKTTAKVWIVLFTCGVYRGIHLELVESLSTEDFLLAFTRFCKRKTRPSVVYTDNGSNFVGAVNLFGKIDWSAVEIRTQHFRIMWKFNPPAAPWWGGWWERLIRSVKDLLKRMLGFGKLGYVELETCLCEVEAVVNHRPLTFVTEDQEDLVALTPSMFLHNLPMSDVPEAKVVKVSSLGARKQSLDKLLQEIKDRFRKEYLGLLVQRGEENKVQDHKVGDFVLVGRENQKRIFWPMAKIVEFIAGKDGVQRVARLQTKNGFLLRPIQRLYPLEFAKDDFLYDHFQKSEKKGEPDRPVKVSTKNESRAEGSAGDERKTRSGRVIRTASKFCDY